MDAVFITDCGNGAIDNIIYRYLGPYKIAHSIRKVGYSAQVIDHVMTMTQDELMSYCLKFIDNKTKLIGLSATFLCMFPHVHSDGVKRRMPEHVFRCLRKLKKQFPDATFVVGGNTAEHMGSYETFDCNVEGDGEDIIRELIQYLHGHGEEPLFRREAPRWGTRIVKIYYSARNKQYDIENDDFKFTEQDCIIEGETLPIEISRGCIFKCKFCQYDKIGRGKLDYLRQMDHIKEEMLHNYEKWGITRYHILCDTFNDTTIKLNMFEEMVKSLPFKIQFRAYIRADLVHRFPETAIQLQECGLIGAYHGIESFGPEASKVIGKGWSGKHGKEYLPELYHNVWGGKVIQHLSFIAGLPHDSYKSILETMAWFKSNKMHSLTYHTLFLSSQSYRNQSEFEKNYEKYGYSFEENGKPSLNWQHKEWKFNELQKFMARIRKQIRSTSKLGDQEALNWLGAGMTMDEVFVMKNKFDTFRAAQLREEFIQKYKNKLSSI